jgi:hypothetical protein
MELRSDQQRCHRIPNKILVDAYNTTSSQQIKKEIIAFNYSKLNMFAGAHNDDHSAMERDFDTDMDSITMNAFKRKSDMMQTALSAATACNEYSDDFFCHLMETMSCSSEVYFHFVRSLDQRQFKAYPKTKQTIKDARDVNENADEKQADSINAAFADDDDDDDNDDDDDDDGDDGDEDHPEFAYSFKDNDDDNDEKAQAPSASMNSGRSDSRAAHQRQPNALIAQHRQSSTPSDFESKHFPDFDISPPYHSQHDAQDKGPISASSNAEWLDEFETFRQGLQGTDLDDNQLADLFFLSKESSSSSSPPPQSSSSKSSEAVTPMKPRNQTQAGNNGKQLDQPVDNCSTPEGPVQRRAGRKSSEWDKFRKSLKGCGLSKQEISQLYVNSKLDADAEGHPAQPPVAEKAKPAAKNAVNDQGKAGKEAAENGEEKVPIAKKADVQPNPNSSTRKSSAWDIYRTKLKGTGMTTQQMSKSYQENKLKDASNVVVNNVKVAAKNVDQPGHRESSAWDIYRSKMKGKGMSVQEMSSLYQKDLLSVAASKSSVTPVKQASSKSIIVDTPVKIQHSLAKSSSSSNINSSSSSSSSSSTSPLGDRERVVDKGVRSPSAWDEFRSKNKGMGYSAQKMSELYQKQQQIQSAINTVRSPIPARSFDKHPNQAVTPSPSRPQYSRDVYEQTPSFGMGMGMEYGGGFNHAMLMGAGYGGNNNAFVTMGQGGRSEGGGRASNAWNEFQKANAGQGLSRSEMSSRYKASKR